jgi:Tfp pilus assembly protein PilF
LRRLPRTSPWQRLCPLLLACICALATATPFTPASDAQVLATVPARASDPAARELAALRQAWRQQPGDLAVALRLAERSFAQVAVEGDPRYIGQAQAVLQPWWTLAAPPVGVRVLRAQLLQFDHHFDAALADLDAALAAQPDNGTAWSWRTAILMVQADYAQARQSCERLAPLATPLIGAACLAQVDSVTGHAAAAAAHLRAALDANPQADAAERLWALTRLAENDERRGAYPQAEAAFRTALALGLSDVYLQAAYADFLLDRGRPAEVLTLLADGARADVLLLRLALAAQAAGTRDASRWRNALAARFDAARQRGDTSHRKEESRFVLALNAVAGDTGATARALQLAQQNFAEQREPADARILLEAALAARQPAAARPALDWMAVNRVESVALQGLAAKLQALQ